jgi:hypothetical protein
MEWERSSNDQVEMALSHLLGLSAAALAEVCDLLLVVDHRQQFLADGSPDPVQWLSARFGLSHPTARLLVDTSRRLVDLPRLRAEFSSGELSFDQVETISRMATPENEVALIE